jgi:peroxiredoxin
MESGPRKSRVIDIFAGFTAICVVLATSISIHAVGSDLRSLFAITGTAFFLAGLARGRSVVHNIWSHGLLVSCPGFLGTAALIMNDGFHRLLIPIALAVAAIFVTVSGIKARQLWSSSRNKSWTLCVASFSALALVVFIMVPRLSILASLKHPHGSVPAFALSGLDGSPVKSSDLRGHVVVLAFWTTWCLPCNWEFERLYQRFQNNPEVTFWAVDADWGGETAAKAKLFLESKQLHMPAAFDSGGAARALGVVESLPTMVILDQQGQVRIIHYGYDASEHLETVVSKAIESLLTSPPSKHLIGKEL